MTLDVSYMMMVTWKLENRILYGSGNGSHGWITDNLGSCVKCSCGSDRLSVVGIDGKVGCG